MMTTFKRLFNRREDFSTIEVVFVSKDDCHLCDIALDVVEEVRRSYPFMLQVVKIKPGDEWHDRYWDKIPVVLIDGRMAFKYTVDPDELLRKMRASLLSSQ
jgi:hypothetical protein